jgi:hypothetical protein
MLAFLAVGYWRRAGTRSPELAPTVESEHHPAQSGLIRAN